VGRIGACNQKFAMIWAGTAGWAVPSKPKEPGSHLFHYSRMLPCAEINSCFYRSHRAATWARWAAETPDDFRFAVKAPKTITHERKLVDAEPLLRTFFAEVRALGEKLGPVLFQLPPSLTFDPAVAEAFLDAVRSLLAGDVVLEARHGSWFGEEAGEVLRRCGIARVAADPAKGGPEASEPGGDASLAYYRLHGSPRTYYSDYDDEFLSQLAIKIAPRPRVWVIFDNTAAGKAFPDAVRLQQLLAGPTVQPVRFP
jgi:uncharacterized protein YecE (DUF72 family)